MFKVMIVDDETIILSGIKSLVNWEENDCEIAATARNGQDALEQMRKIPIDIVLADINMPVMDGITLMKKASEEFPNTVFIMLTNLEEFELARQALQYHAVDYLVKSQLEAPMLEKALEHAKTERGERAYRTVTSAADYMEKEEKKKVISSALQEVIFLKHGLQNEEYIKLLKDSGILTSYCYFYIPFDFLAISGEPVAKGEKARLMEWIQEMLVKTAENIFGENYILLDTGSSSASVLFAYRVSAGGNADPDVIREKKFDMFGRKLVSSVKTVTQVECHVFHTQIHDGFDELKKCAGEYRRLMEQYYLGIADSGEYSEGSEEEYEPLGLKGIGSELYHEIMQKNLKGIRDVMDNVETQISNTVHQKSQAIWLLNELNREAAAALSKFGIMETSTYERVSSIAVIESINTRKQILSWLSMLRNTLIDVVGNGDMPGNPLAEKARRYVLNNIESNLSLQDTAEHVGVSAGYLSTIFKREYNQSFVDFVNATKIEHACRLLQEKDLMVMEIAYRLGYENAYYFSKVFRKYMGMSPTDYQRRMEDEKNTSKLKK